MASRTLSLPLPRRSRPAGAHAARPGLPRPRLRLVVTALAIVLLLGAGSWWLRDSAVVGVTEVTVTGIRGDQAADIRAALTDAAQDMTTLHVREDLLRTAVARYPIIAGVVASGDFPHRLDISVTTRTPVASLHAGGRSITVAADGTLLPGTRAAGLPVVTTKEPPAGARLQDAVAAAQVRILAGAPAPLLRQVTKTFAGSRGLELQLRNGPVVAFGAPERIAAKWAALMAVLVDPASRGGTLIDLSVPERPAVSDLEPLRPATDDDGVPDAVGQSGATAADPTAADPSTSTATTLDPTAPVTPPATTP